MFNDDPSSAMLALSPAAVAELRSDHFNAKRWLSRAMAEAKKRAEATAAASADKPSGDLPPQHHAGRAPSVAQHADPTGRSPTAPSPGTPTTGGTAFGRRPAAAPTSDEAVAQQLVTLLGVRKQAAAETLEDTITGALRYLPRATEDISRLAQETATMRERLDGVAATAVQVRDSSGVSDRLKDLHRVRERLVNCRTVLSDAQLLSSRVSSVETAIGTLTQPRDDSAAAGGTRSQRTAASASDLEEFNRVADDIAAMRQALQTLRAIDPNYGASVRTQVDRFEQAMQRALETQCLEALKREDRQTAPPLLLALGKIGRDSAVLRSHCSNLVSNRAAKFESEVVSATTATSSGDKVSSTLRRFAHSLVKAMAKDREFFIDIFPKDDRMGHASFDGSAAMDATATNISASNMNTSAGSTAAGASSSSSSGKLTGVAAFRQYLADMLRALAAHLNALLDRVSGDTANLVAASVMSDLVAPVLASLAPASDDTGATPVVTRAALVQELRGPLVSFAAKFAAREVAAVKERTQAFDKPQQLHDAAEIVVASAGCVTQFMKLLLADGIDDPALDGERNASTNRDASAQLFATVSSQWNASLEGFASRVINTLPKTAVPSSSDAPSSSSAVTRGILEAALAAHAKCADLPAQIDHVRHEVNEVVATLRDALSAEAAAALWIDGDSLDAKPLLVNAAAAVRRIPAACRDRVLDVILEPARKFMPSAKGVAASAGQPQSETVRELGEWVMELPMTLDSAGVTTDAQDWVAASVVYLLRLYADAVRAALTTAGTAVAGAADQQQQQPQKVSKDVADTLLGDLEYLESVVAAIDETPENTSVFRELRRNVVVAAGES